MKNLLVILAVVVLGMGGATAYLYFQDHGGEDPLVSIVSELDSKLTGADSAPAESQPAPPAPVPQNTTPQIAQAAAAPVSAALSPARQSGQGIGDAGPLLFGMPIDCAVGRNCVIQNYVDMAPGETYQDPQCGSLSYNEHKGTDFRLPSHREMEAGVDVIAAAPGTVLRLREGMPDVNFRLVGRNAITRQGLGNVVVLSHRDGYLTAYGHLKRGSVRVQPGDTVAAGDVLGQVGLSGLTEFPHVHFEIRKDGEIVDPFTGAGPETGCGNPGNNLWTAAAQALIDYYPTLIVRIGFFDSAVNRNALEYDLLSNVTELPSNAENLLLHVYLAGIREGDVARFEIFSPDGQQLVLADQTLDKDAAVQVIRGGIGNRTTPFPPGEYRGTFTLSRMQDGIMTQILSANSQITLN